MSHPYLFNAGLGLSLVPGLIGVNMVFRPEAVLRSIEFPVPAEESSRKLTRSLLRMYAIRNMSISYLLGLLWYNGNERLMGVGFLAAMVMCTFDGFVSRSLIGGGEQYHWTFAPIIGGVSAGLLGWF